MIWLSGFIIDHHFHYAVIIFFLTGIVSCSDDGSVGSPNMGMSVDTTENHFKFRQVSTGLNEYNWTQADYIANYATDNKKRLHGHVLLWHQSIPDWLQNLEGSEEEWDNIIKNHITTIMTRYKGKVASWDVVNEALGDFGGGMRDSFWKEKLGDDYVEKCFLWAQEADPNALLFYNDFNLLSLPAKLDATIDLCNQIREKGIRVDGIGLQGHLFFANALDSLTIAEAFDKVVSNDYLVHISELDVPMNFSANNERTDKLLQRQKELYRLISTTYSTISAKYQHGITL